MSLQMFFKEYVQNVTSLNISLASILFSTLNCCIQFCNDLPWQKGFINSLIFQLWDENKENINEHFVQCLVETRRKKKKYAFIKKIGLCGDFQPFPFFSSFEQNTYQDGPCICYNILGVTKSFSFLWGWQLRLGSQNSLRVFFLRLLSVPVFLQI